MEDNDRSEFSTRVPMPKGHGYDKFVPNPKLKLLEQCREVFRFYHYSHRTEEAEAAPLLSG